MGTREAAARLGCRPETVFRIIRRGQLPAVKVIDRWLVPTAALEKLAESYRARRGRPPKERPGVKAERQGG